MQNPQINDIVELTIHDLGISGEGVGRLNGYTLFVEGALPGETIRCRLTECRKNFGRALLLDVLISSPLRVKPVCPLFDRCGGCQIMHMNYDGQLEFKRQRVAKALQHIGKFSDLNVPACRPSPSELHYRNKIQLITAPSDLGLSIGVYARHSHDVVEIERCFIHCPLGEKVFNQLSKILKKLNVPAYDPTTGQGLLKNILIKTAVYTEQVLIVLVTNGEANKVLIDAAEQIMREAPAVKGVVENINRRSDNVVLGKEYRLLAGQDHIMETLNGLSFKVSPASFFQVNPAQALHLYQEAIQLADLQPNEKVLDAYSGVGTLSLSIAMRAKHVVAIENVPEAINDARENAERNNIANVEFHCANVESFIGKMDEKIDTVFLNPPRKGCEPAVIKAMARLKPQKIIYISCDPATLARDLALMCEQGYKIDAVQPFDMFPQTAHVETVVKLVLESNTEVSSH